MMSKNISRLVAAAVLILAGHAHAMTVVVTGTNFDLKYDDTKLGLFGSPSFVGNQIFFTPNMFTASSTNTTGLVNTNSTINGLELISKNGFIFNSISLAEFGDYQLSGAGSKVSVSGQLRAFDANNAMATQTSSNLVVSETTPLNLNDGTNHNWMAQASISNATPGSFLSSKPNDIFIAVENILTATSSVMGGQAFIEKKFAGGSGSVVVTINEVTAPVPEPSTWLLMLAGLGVVGALGARNKRAAQA